jgi:LPS-assembly lipoprotein
MWRTGLLTLSLNRKIFMVAALLALGGCGFSPVYGGGDDVQARLDEVKVAPIADRPGQQLRQAIDDEMQVAGNPTQQLYLLTVDYSIGSQGIGVQADTATTRQRFNATAHWVLSPIGNPGQTLASGMASTEDALNIINQQYFAQTLETNTVNGQLAQEIAGQIVAQVSIYFKAHPAG